MLCLLFACSTQTLSSTTGRSPVCRVFRCVMVLVYLCLSFSTVQCRTTHTCLGVFASVYKNLHTKLCKNSRPLLFVCNHGTSLSPSEVPCCAGDAARYRLHQGQGVYKRQSEAAPDDCLIPLSTEGLGGILMLGVCFHCSPVLLRWV